MIDHMNNLAEMTDKIGGWNLLILVVVIIVLIDYGFKLFDSVTSRLGFTTKWSRKSMEQEEKIKKYGDSIQILTEDMTDMKTSFQEMKTHLEQEQEKADKRERNKLRDRLLQSYRYYSNPEKNPMLSWSEMESDAFWQMFKDYEDLNGDGFLHTEVQNTMNRLTVIPMSDIVPLTKIISQRK